MLSSRLLLRVVAVGFAACFATDARAQSTVTTALVRRANSTGTAPRLGDRVTVTGRVTLGWGVLDTAQVNIYVQDSTGGIFVDADAPTPFIRPAVGDSVIVSGIVQNENGEAMLDDATVIVLPVARSIPTPARIEALVPPGLAPHASWLAVLDGIVVSTSRGRGDRILTVSDTTTEGSFVTVLDDDDGLGLDLGRFNVGDRIRVTGVLVRRASRRTGITRFAMHPRTAMDVVPRAMTASTRRTIGWSVSSSLALALFAGFTWRSRRRRVVARREADQARDELTARYRVLVDQAPIGIVVVRGGSVVYANTAFSALIGVPVPASLHGRPFADLCYSDEIVSAPSTPAMPAPGPRPPCIPKRLKRVDRGIVDVEITEGAIVYDGEQCVQMVVHDVSDRARVERALAESEAQLRQAQKLEAVGQLAGGVAHDFNNILTAIKGNASLLLDGCGKCGEVSEEAHEIDQAANRAAGLTGQLLAFSRKQVSAPQVIELDALVKNLERLLGRLVPESVTQRFALSATKSLVKADPGQLEQVIMNLVVNAKDAMPLGGALAIRTSNVIVDDAAAETEDDGVRMRAGSYVCLTVSDTGVGMDETTRRRAFEPFFTTKEQGKGTGLGLSTVYGIVKQSGGYVFLNAIPGMGTTVKIYLPRVDAVLEERRTPPEPVEESRRGVETILIVEDEPAIRRITARTLERHGYAVLLAENAMEALSVVRGHVGRIDMLLTDVIMPGLSGAELASHLCKVRGTLRVLFMSGYTDDHIVTHGVLAPGVELLQKPFTPSELLEHVRRVLDKQSSAVA